MFCRRSATTSPYCPVAFKRKPGRDPTPEQRTFNRAHCMVRIPCQNGIRRVEVFRIMKEMYGNKPGWYDRINDIACGVVNQTILLKRDGIIWGAVAGQYGRESYGF